MEYSLSKYKVLRTNKNKLIEYSEAEKMFNLKIRVYGNEIKILKSTHFLMTEVKSPSVHSLVLGSSTP